MIALKNPGTPRQCNLSITQLSQDVIDVSVCVLNSMRGSREGREFTYKGYRKKGLESPPWQTQLSLRPPILQKSSGSVQL